jgi:hypothetical protein
MGTAGSGGTPGSAGTAGAGGDAGVGGATGMGGEGGMGGMGGDMGGGGGSGGAPVKMPTGVQVNGEMPTMVFGNSSGGGNFYSLCGANEVLLGFPDATTDSSDTSMSPWLKSADAQCASLTLSGKGPFTVTISTTVTLPSRGKASDLMQQSNCPADQVMIGFTGSSGDYIDWIAPICAPLTVVGDATNGYSLQIGQSTVVTNKIGGSGGVFFGEIYCGPGQVVRGWTGYSGDWFDKFGMVCGELSLAGMRFSSDRRL